jgi:formylglycine-generating enzyme required for sulfatase activity
MILQRLEAEADAGIRQALILGLGEYGPTELPEAVRQRWLPRLLAWYRDDPDPGVHGALDWLLRQGQEGPTARKLDWGQARELQRIDQERQGKPAEKRRWYVNGQGQTLTIVPGPVEFLMGAPTAEGSGFGGETQHRRRIGRGYAIATKAVTVAQFQRFLKGHPQVQHNHFEQFGPDPECPVHGVSWYDEAQYCRWLSEKEGVPAGQMCYPSVAEIEKWKNGQAPLRLPADYLRRTGYRLPTEAEWEYACRAKTRTAWSYGGVAGLVDRYGWYINNSEYRTWPVGQKRPNDLGLFDVHGNVRQWCQDRYRDHGYGTEATEDKEYIKDIISINKRDKGMISSNSRLHRGGAFHERAPQLRSAYRYGMPAGNHLDYSLGFRPARTYP